MRETSDPAGPPLSHAEAGLAARHETLLHRAETSGDYSGLERLHADAVRELGPGNRMVFLVECGLEEMKSRSRPLTESVEVLDALWERARAALSPDDHTLMLIRAYRARYRRRRGRSEDLEAGVEAYRRQWRERCEALTRDHYRTRIMHANLALAVRDRDGEGDLPEALRMLREEAAHRSDRYGEQHPFTWIVRSILAQTLVRSAERAADLGERARHALEAEAIADSLVDRRSLRFGVADISTLRAKLVHAHALLLLGRAGEAIPEIQHVYLRTQRERIPLEPGWTESLLARAELAVGAPSEALHWAEEAQRLKAAYYPLDSRQVIEAGRLVDDLRERARRS
ncbi:hypothetical protein [Actinomadura rubrisoli]|uniref:Tetratricopeptide repeat protein n=1 Tax=Actinomadura rubrisoli TaxID=2530368 RepID=A0A4V2YVR5_9ACTN|nr:hypothetical protein [Actinomadura rubrisoli]TDD82637.1 hypothetical protein E1298_22485 [Actinomadura rubrisoli]